MRKMLGSLVVSAALLTAGISGCEAATSTDSSESAPGGATLSYHAYSVAEFQIYYESRGRYSRAAFLFSNLDVLGSNSVDYHFRILGYGDGHWYEIDRGFLGDNNFDARCVIYDDLMAPLYTIHFAFSAPYLLEEEDVMYRDFEGLIEYTLIEDEVDEESNTISYQSNTPDKYVLEFIGAKGIDIHDYIDQIEEQVDILSRNYVIMDSGVTRYVSISDSSEEEVEA